MVAEGSDAEFLYADEDGEQLIGSRRTIPTDVEMVYIADAEAMAEDHEGLRGSIDEKKADSHSFVAAQVADSFTLWWEPFEAMYTLDKPTDDGTLVFVLTEEGGDLVRDGDATLYRQQAIDDPYVPVEEE